MSRITSHSRRIRHATNTFGTRNILATIEASYEADHEYAPPDFDWDYMHKRALEFNQWLAKLQEMYPDEHPDVLKDMLWAALEHPLSKYAKPDRFRRTIQSG